MEHFHYNSHIILLTAQYLDQLRWMCAVFTMKRVFLTLHRVTYRRADAHLTPVQV